MPDYLTSLYLPLCQYKEHLSSYSNSQYQDKMVVLVYTYIRVSITKIISNSTNYTKMDWFLPDFRYFATGKIPDIMVKTWHLSCLFIIGIPILVRECVYIAMCPLSVASMLPATTASHSLPIHAARHPIPRDAATRWQALDIAAENSTKMTKENMQKRQNSVLFDNGVKSHLHIASLRVTLGSMICNQK